MFLRWSPNVKAHYTLEKPNGMLAALSLSESVLKLELYAIESLYACLAIQHAMKISYSLACFSITPFPNHLFLFISCNHLIGQDIVFNLQKMYCCGFLLKDILFMEALCKDCYIGLSGDSSAQNDQIARDCSRFKSDSN